MAYSEALADRIRESLVNEKQVEEKRLMGGLIFMVNDKMCVGVFNDEMMCRINPEIQDTVLNRKGCREMEMKGRPMSGYILVENEGMQSQKEFDEWIQYCLDFNERAKSSKKKKKKNSTNE